LEQDGSYSRALIRRVDTVRDSVLTRHGHSFEPGLADALTDLTSCWGFVSIRDGKPGSTSHREELEAALERACDAFASWAPEPHDLEKADDLLEPDPTIPQIRT
jgi:hypothetical protein